MPSIDSNYFNITVRREGLEKTYRMKDEDRARFVDEVNNFGWFIVSVEADVEFTWLEALRNMNNLWQKHVTWIDR